MPIHVGHVQVTQHYIGVVERGGREAFNPVLGLKHARPVMLEISYQRVAKNRFIFHHQDP